MNVNSKIQRSDLLLSENSNRDSSSSELEKELLLCKEELRAKEREIDRLRAQLTQSQKLEEIGRLTGGIAHDFNNLLVPIIGYAESVLEDSENLHCRDSIVEIRKAASSAASLTRQLLGFSKKQDLAMTEQGINSVLLEMKRMIERILGEDIELVIETGAGSDVIDADRGQIEQIVVNLCINARDAMPEGGVIEVVHLQ